MTPIVWWIAANTAVTAIAVVLAAWAFLRADQHMRHARNVVQAYGPIAERAAERTQPEPPLLCGDYRPAAHDTARHAHIDGTALMPAVGDLQAGESR